MTAWLLMACAWLVACGGGAGSQTPSVTATAEPETSQMEKDNLAGRQKLRQVSFTSTTAPLDNPERGYYRFASDLSVIDKGFLAETANLGYRLIYTPNDLSAWRDVDLPASYLNGLTEGFAKVRAAGVKVVLRFAYNYPANETEYLNAQDASLTRVRSHIAQLAPVIAANADVIAVWQAGFIGAWGEWHTSSNGLTSANNKLAVRDALLAALPEGRSLQVRYPGDLADWFATPPQASDLELAKLPTRARIGLHNDCFLASADDVGTYYPANRSAALRAHVQSTSDVVAFGAETCWPPVPAQARMDCTDILAEGAAYRLAYLNRGYYQPFFDSWTAGGCMDEIARKMGYRLELQSLHFSATATAGGQLSLALQLRNTGWARLMNDRPLVVHLLNEQGALVYQETISAESELRLLGAGQSGRIEGTLDIPEELAAGRYRIAVSSPDAASSLAGRSVYALRFANADQGQNQYWDSARAMWVTDAWVVLQ